MTCAFNMYSNFDNYIPMFNSILQTIIGALIGALALIFTGIVFWASLFDRKFTEDLIRYSENQDVVDELYTSYLFLGFNIICSIVFSIGILYAINSNIKVVNLYVFLIIEGVYTYLFLFIIGYLIGIMKNCIDLVQLKDDKAAYDQKTIYDTANELRIDILLGSIYQNSSEKEMHDNLMMIINERIGMMDISEEQKKKLADYMEKYYSYDE